MTARPGDVSDHAPVNAPDNAPDNALDEAPATVVLCADGPMLVRAPAGGEVVVEDVDGVRHRSSRPVTAVCRCGASARAPWCDGTHQLLARAAAAKAARD